LTGLGLLHSSDVVCRLTFTSKQNVVVMNACTLKATASIAEQS
jgi:hypothetical protein